MTETELLRLALMTYEASADPSLWSVFLEECAHALPADVTLIQVHRFSHHRSDIHYVFGLASRFRDSYNTHYSRLNVWREHGQSSYVQGRVLFGEETCPKELLKASEFYNDYLQPMGSVCSLAGVITRDQDCALMITTLRDEHRPAFELSDKKVLDFLLPHLRRALLLQQKQAIFQAGESVVDRISLGIVFFTADGKAIYANCTAEAIFHRNDGLSVKSGRLIVTLPAQTAAIQLAIRQAAAMDFSSDCPDTFIVERESLGRAYQVAVTPLRKTAFQLGGASAPAAMAVITDPDQQSFPASQLLRQLYGLTPKEAELSGKLCAGTSVRQAAAELDMQYETARTHLRRIYTKTGASRQNELVALLNRVTHY